MRIIATVFYNNSNISIKNYELSTNIDTVINDTKAFILNQTPTIDYNNLIVQWSELIKFSTDYPKITLRLLLRKKKRFTIGYGGYIRFETLYEDIEVYDNTLLTEEIDSKTMNIFKSVIPYLSIDDKLSFSLSSKRFYKIIFLYEHKYKSLQFINSIEHNILYPSTNAIIARISLDKFYQNNRYLIFGVYEGKISTYLLVFSFDARDVSIIKVNNKDTSNQELIFHDQWTDYFMNSNVVYQIKYENKKPLEDKITNNIEAHEIRLLVINSKKNPLISSGDFTIQQFYAYQPFKTYILTTNKILYEINHKKGKLIEIFNFSLQSNKFNSFISHCKIRQYYPFVKFIGEYMFLSLNKFHIENILNKRNMNTFSTIKGIDCVENLNKRYFFVRNQTNIFLLSKRDFEIDISIKRTYTQYCSNNYHLVDEAMNRLDSQLFIKNKKKDNINYQNIDKGELCIKYNNELDVYSCYQTDRFLYIKLLNKEGKEKTIQISMKPLIEKITEGITQTKQKKNIVFNMQPRIFFNGYGDIIIFIYGFYWLYQYEEASAPLIKLVSQSEVITKRIFTPHNYIFTKDKFLLWAEDSTKILLVEYKKNNNIQMLSFNTLKQVNRSLNLSPIFFLFEKESQLYLVTSYIQTTFSVNKISIVPNNENTNENIIVFTPNVDNENFMVSLPGFQYEKNEKIVYINIIKEGKNMLIFTSFSIFLNTYDPISRCFLLTTSLYHDIRINFYVTPIEKDEMKYIVYYGDRIKYYNISTLINK